MTETLSGSEVNKPRRLRRLAGAGALWLSTSAAIAGYGFFTDETETTLAGNVVSLSPTLDSYATFENGLLIPSVRYPLDSPVGLNIDVQYSAIPASEKKVGGSIETLTGYYAAIAAQPNGEIAKGRDAMYDMAQENLAMGLLAGTGVQIAWRMVGSRRRRELIEELSEKLPQRVTLAVSLGVVCLAATSSQLSPNTSPSAIEWRRVSDVMPQFSSYEFAHNLEVRTDIITGSSVRLLDGGLDNYAYSKQYYGEIKDKVASIAHQLRQPEEGETVALLVADRHDNIGMDPVALAIAEAAGVSTVLDAGDDTSSGASWEAFSIDSLMETFADYEVVVAPGNHDNTGFVANRFKDKGAHVLAGEPIEVNGISILGVPDPRYSDYTPEKRDGEMTIEELGEQVADIACSNDEPISTLLVHDRNVGDIALEKGCIDAVFAGHDHTVSQIEVMGEDGEMGYGYTSGSTGGAAMSFALGKKLQRDASLALITYNTEERPIGIQPITVTVQQEIIVAPFQPYTYSSEAEAAGVKRNRSESLGRAEN